MRFSLTTVLLVQPDLIQMLVQIVARCDLPALHIGTVRVDLVPPQRRDEMSHLANRTRKPAIDLFQLHVLVAALIVACAPEVLGHVGNRVDD